MQKKTFTLSLQSAKTNAITEAYIALGLEKLEIKQQTLRSLKFP
jgi:hypothetical protein